MKVYIAASFCYEDKDKTSERKYLIEKTVDKIKKHLTGDFYIPHQLKIENAWDISLEEWARKVYEHDIDALNNSDLVVFISFGKENNAGSVWECGYAYAKNKPVVVIKMTEDMESLMVSNTARAIIREAEIDAYDFTNLPAYKTSLDKLG